MKINKIISLIFDTFYFVFSALICLFVFFYISDNIASESSFPILLGFLGVAVLVFPLYLVYSFIDKIISNEK